MCDTSCAYESNTACVMYCNIPWQVIKNLILLIALFVERSVCSAARQASSSIILSYIRHIYISAVYSHNTSYHPPPSKHGHDLLVFKTSDFPVSADSKFYASRRERMLKLCSQEVFGGTAECCSYRIMQPAYLLILACCANL